MNIDELNDRRLEEYLNDSRWDPPVEYICNTCEKYFDDHQTEGDPQECYHCNSIDFDKA